MDGATIIKDLQEFASNACQMNLHADDASSVSSITVHTDVSAEKLLAATNNIAEAASNIVADVGNADVGDAVGDDDVAGAENVPAEEGGVARAGAQDEVAIGQRDVAAESRVVAASGQRQGGDCWTWAESAQTPTNTEDG